MDKKLPKSDETSLDILVDKFNEHLEVELEEFSEDLIRRRKSPETDVKKSYDRICMIIKILENINNIRQLGTTYTGGGKIDYL